MYRLSSIDIKSYMVHLLIINVAVTITVNTYVYCAFFLPKYVALPEYLVLAQMPTIHGYAIWSLVHLTFVIVYNLIAQNSGGILFEAHTSLEPADFSDFSDINDRSAEENITAVTVIEDFSDSEDPTEMKISLEKEEEVTEISLSSPIEEEKESIAPEEPKVPEEAQEEEPASSKSDTKEEPEKEEKAAESNVIDLDL